MHPSFCRGCVLGGLLLLALLCPTLLGAQHSRPLGATIVVTNTNDSGPGSLRQALANVNDGGTIQFDLALNGQTISLTSGELAINKNITINGPGSALLLTIARSTNAQSSFRVFHVTPGHTVVIRRITITNGAAGGIFNDAATLTIDNCTVANNQGGGILNTGILTITHSIISGNSGAYGGGVYNDGTLTITQTTINQNTVFGYGAGIYNDSSAALIITDSTITSNTARNANQFALGRGAGIFSYGSLVMTNCLVSQNSSEANIGGILSVGSATISHCTITGNSAHISAGGIADTVEQGAGGDGSLLIVDSTVSGNVVDGGNGGGILHAGAGQITILNSTINDNMAGFRGGGICNESPWTSSPMFIANSTISHNSAGGEGGGTFNTGTLTIGNTTVSGNSTLTGSGGGITNSGTGATLRVGDTILNTGTLGANLASAGTGPIISVGHNLSSDNGGGFLIGPGDQINTDPMLAPLQDNGGLTFTHALAPGSLAIDAGGASITTLLLYDQRGPGYDRVVGNNIDIGSFEAQSPAYSDQRYRPR